MSTTTRKRRRTPTQIATEGFAALVDKLGMADAIRFLHVHDSGHGDYTRERSEWLDRLSAEEVQRLMAKAPKKKPGKRKVTDQ